MRLSRLLFLHLAAGFGLIAGPGWTAESSRPHIVLVMADDQGWGEIGYNGHPVLKTPELDEMAAVGGGFQLFDLGADPSERRDLATAQPETLRKLCAAFRACSESVDACAAGKDHPEGRVNAADLITPRSGTTEFQPRGPREPRVTIHEDH